MTTDFNLLRRRLETERKSLMEERERLKANVCPADERREGSFELEKCLVLEKRIIGQLAKVEHALHKFDQGTYGLCDICGQPIEPARLEALPQASLCLSCKEAKNSKGRSPLGTTG